MTANLVHKKLRSTSHTVRRVFRHAHASRPLISEKPALQVEAWLDIDGQLLEVDVVVLLGRARSA